MPFLRLTRDRRGFENTFLLHADHPGAKPRLLYWYRTAPDIALGRPALDEDAIRTIEEQHPDIEFDWPALIALSEVMTPEEEPAFVSKDRKPRGPRRPERGRGPRGPAAPAPIGIDEAATAIEPAQPAELDELEPDDIVEPDTAFDADDVAELVDAERVPPVAAAAAALVDSLAGREIARTLRARYAEIRSRIERLAGDRDAWLARAEAINPDSWLTPEAVLQGVSSADAAYEQLKAELYPPRE